MTASVGRQAGAIIDEIITLRATQGHYAARTLEISVASPQGIAIQAKIDALNAELKVITNNPKFPTF